MKISCEVEVVRDNGYGKLRHSKKLGESPIRSFPLIGRSNRNPMETHSFNSVE